MFSLSSRSSGGSCCLRLLGLARELHLKVALWLTWHEACTFWLALQPLPEDSDDEWRLLVSALVAERGHDEAFLADLSILRESLHYLPLLTAYSLLFPEVIRKALTHRFSLTRLLERLLISDDVGLLQLLLSSHKKVVVESHTLVAAIERRAQQCLKLLFAEASSVKAKGLLAPRVRLEFPRRVVALGAGVDSTFVDFGHFPQRLLWAAALTRDVGVCKEVLTYLREVASGDAAAMARIRLWAVSCGVACGNVPLIAGCGPDELQGALARVSFKAPPKSGPAGAGSFEELQFEDTPLAVVAATLGHVAAVEELVRSGVDMQLCTRRGLTALEAARQSGHAPAVQKALEAALLAGEQPGARSLPPLAPTRTSSRSGTGTAPAEGGCPIATAILRGDVSTLRSLLQRGGRLQQSDIMAAVNSGDLDMLAFVQSECAAGAGGDEYRQMMRQTAQQIRAASKASRSFRSPVSLPPLTSSGSGTALRQAAESVLVPWKPLT